MNFIPSLFLNVIVEDIAPDKRSADKYSSGNGRFWVYPRFVDRGRGGVSVGLVFEVNRRDVAD